jgi:acetyltransferase-like isoleucine patch superfamily enzyme
VSSFLARLRGAWYTSQAQRSGGKVTIGRGFVAYTRLDLRGPGRVEIGDDVEIGPAPAERREFVTIYTRSPGAVVKIGRGSRLYGARLSAMHRIELGEEVLIEQAGVADTDFHTLDRDRGTPDSEERERCAVIIGDRVSIGSRAMVTKGVRIGADAIIAPAAIVSRSLPPGCLAMGNPARTVERSPGAQPISETM